MTEAEASQEATGVPQEISTEGAYSPQIQKAIGLGNKEYALKNYEKAVEHYGQASELQYFLLSFTF